MPHSDDIRIEMLDSKGPSIFGAIHQQANVEMWYYKKYLKNHHQYIL
jgi:hypothetical protein